MSYDDRVYIMAKLALIDKELKTLTEIIYKHLEIKDGKDSGEEVREASIAVGVETH